MSRRIRFAVVGFAALALIWLTPISAQPGDPVPASQPASPAAVYQHWVNDLTAPQMQGRGVDTKGIELARDYIVAEFTRAGLQPAFGEKGYLQSFDMPIRRVNGKMQNGPVQNIVGVIPGRGRLASEIVVVGGHYDHIGLTGKTNAASQPGYFPGADDNASGASGVMMLAHWFVENEKNLPAGDRRTLVLATFTGEERGLWGSAYLASHLPDWAKRLPATRPDGETRYPVVAMIALDMIGRLRNNRIFVEGVESGDRWRDVVNEASLTSKLEVHAGGGGSGPSDHASFYAKRVPVLFFITGGHSDVHRETDTADKINAAGAVEVLRLVQAIVESLRTDPVGMAYVAPKPVAKVASSSAYIGVMPDPTGIESDGCALMRVVEGGPADRAGLKADDVVIKWNGKPVTGTASFLAAIGGCKPGDQATVRVRRGDKELDVPVTLGNLP